MEDQVSSVRLAIASFEGKLVQYMVYCMKLILISAILQVRFKSFCWVFLIQLVLYIGYSIKVFRGVNAEKVRQLKAKS